MKVRLSIAFALMAGAVVIADEGMWRIDRVPVDRIGQSYGVTLTPQDIDRLRASAVQVLAGGSAGTGTFASANGLILTNHHVALDCIRTSTLAEENSSGANNLIEEGFVAKSPADELGCKRFRVRAEQSTRDVTAELAAAVTPEMTVGQSQQAKQAVRSNLERECQRQKGSDVACTVVDFNSGAKSELITYEEYKDVRLVYAPEKDLGYFGGDEMNFRFPRYVSDISILRVYQAADGSRGDYDKAHVMVKPRQFMHVTLAGIKDGDFSLVAGFPGNTNRYRLSFSADYNIRKGIPDQIRDLETELAVLRKQAAADPTARIALQSDIFGLSNSLKYQQDVVAALKATGVVAQQQQREREFLAWVGSRPELKAEYGGVIEAQGAVYANDVEANADLDSALSWLQRPSLVSYATTLYQFAMERAKSSDHEREPQYQERNWPRIKQALLNDDPIFPALEQDLLTVGFERALALPASRQIPAVKQVSAGLSTTGAPDARQLAARVLGTSSIGALEKRRALIDAPLAELQASTDPALVFARDLEPSLNELRARVRVLNEKLFRDRARFARGLSLWKGAALYPDANFTLRVSYGKTAGYVDAQGKPVPFTTKFADLFALADARRNTGEFALPHKLREWRAKIGDAVFAERYADLPVDFITTNDITGGNSGSSTLNRNLEVVGLIFDGNQDSMASDWAYDGTRARALSTDIRFALTIAREVHGAGWIVDELMEK